MMLPDIFAKEIVDYSHFAMSLNKFTTFPQALRILSVLQNHNQCQHHKL